MSHQRRLIPYICWTNCLFVWNVIFYRIIITPLYMCATQTTLNRLKQPKNFYSVYILDSTTFCHGSTWLYLTVQHSTFALLHSTMATRDSTWLCCILPWLYLALLHSNMALLGSTWLYYMQPWLYLTLLHSTMALLHCTIALLDTTWLYSILLWLYMTTLYNGFTLLYLTLQHYIIARPGSTCLYYALP